LNKEIKIKKILKIVKHKPSVGEGVVEEL